jgi:hypothetical protein
LLTRTRISLIALITLPDDTDWHCEGKTRPCLVAVTNSQDQAKSAFRPRPRIRAIFLRASVLILSNLYDFVLARAPWMPMMAGSRQPYQARRVFTKHASNSNRRPSYSVDLCPSWNGTVVTHSSARQSKDAMRETLLYTQGPELPRFRGS